MRDLTERHRMRAMLMQSEKLASIGLLSAGVAHEINNPLSYIANNLAVLERDVRGMLEMIGAYESAGEALRASAPEVAQRIERIAADLDWPYVRSNLDRMLQRTREGVKRVATIVGHMRGMARTEAPNLEPASLADLIDSALEMVEPRLKKSGITLSVDRVPLSKIACVPTQVSQVMINLLVNAVQAMEGFARPGGHKLWIRLGSGSGEQFFAIADTGPGIAPQNLDRIFDPFYSSKPVGEGTGLGLSISHSIVSGHGGRIEVSSTPGAGSTFTVYLPERSPT
jgi:signal transduction histidine kinase